MKKFVLYTAVFGQRRAFRIPKITIPDVDKICYTDLNLNVLPFYQIKKMKIDHLDRVRRQRSVKILIPDEIFDNYEYSVYVDCKRNVIIDFEYILSFMDSGSDFVTREHRKRRCVYEEGRVCIAQGKDSETIILKQLDFYRSENYPVHNGLQYTFMILRRHTKELKEFMNLWWEQLTTYSYRDQISLPYVAWKHDIKVSLCGRGGKWA